LERRLFVVTMAASVIPGPRRAAAQPRVPRVGYLRFTGASSSFDDAFRSGLQELGYVVGRTILIEHRYAEGSIERLARLAAELVALTLDVIVAAGTQAVEAARRATRTIPIVFPVTFDPVASGFVASLARPGGNLTGLSPLNPAVTAKRVELLREALPHVTRVAVLWNPTNPGSAFVLRETEMAARRTGIALQVLEVRTVADLEAAFADAARGGRRPSWSSPTASSSRSRDASSSWALAIVSPGCSTPAALSFRED